MADKRCRHHGTPGRTLHLIDIENLVRGSGATPARVVGALAAYRATVSVGPGDHVVIGSGDGIFAARAAELRLAGVVVAVVSLRECLAIDLRDNAALVRRLPTAVPG